LLSQSERLTVRLLPAAPLVKHGNGTGGSVTGEAPKGMKAFRLFTNRLSRYDGGFRC
jgi:hypothetical protein